jgi:hypothetical protein
LTAAATIVVTIRAMALTSRREFIPLTVHRRVLFRRARPPKTHETIITTQLPALFCCNTNLPKL